MSAKARQIACCLLILFSTSPFIFGQGTGLVLSGGGAKGLAHIGVIKALEDNNIKIDYVSGTSIGAIIGGLYVMGYTTDEMLELFKSEDFGRWKTGEIEPKYQFRYKSAENNPSIINIPLKRENKKATTQIRTYFIPSHAMDFAIMELTCGADAASGGNFNNLMVPYRSVAADIYQKEAVVFRKGSLSKGVRTSMTYPIVFEPIYVNSKLLFDGGIYNNFPFDVLMDDFHPDFIIGSKVVSKTKRPEKDDIMSQLENMIMTPTNYSIPDSVGLVIESELKDIDLLDFGKADSLFNIGYKSAIKMMPEIIKRSSFISDSNLNLKREEFKSKIPDLKFKNIFINGVDPAQEEYIRNQISKKEEIFDLKQLKEEYFRLISEENILNAYPEAIYNNDDGTFDLLLDVKLKGSYNLSAGGLLSVTNYNQAYLGFEYYMLSDIFNRFSGNMYLGRYYSSFQLAHHIAIPQKNILLIDLSLTGSRWNYYRNDLSSLFDTYLPSYIIRNETAFTATAGRPLSSNATIKSGISFSWINDNYHQTRFFDEEEEPDNTDYFFSTAKIVVEGDNLDQKQFATNGNRLKGGVYINTGFEFDDVFPTDTIDIYEEENIRHNWIALRLRNENYTTIKERFVIGTLIDITLSNRRFSGNYTSTMINSYRFNPTPFSRQIYGLSLRSNSYLAAGVMPLYKITNSLSVRTGAYFFAPLYPVNNNDGQPENDDLLAEIRAIGELGIVYHTPIGPISTGVNYFSHESRKVYYYLNFGYILFNKSGIE